MRDQTLENLYSFGDRLRRIYGRLKKLAKVQKSQKED
jgi:hypothetical protein